MSRSLSCDQCPLYAIPFSSCSSHDPVDHKSEEEWRKQTSLKQSSLDLKVIWKLPSMCNSAGHSLITALIVIWSWGDHRNQAVLRVSLSTLSNAFSSSMKLTPSDEFHFKDCSIMMGSVAMWSVHDLFGLRPAWLLQSLASFNCRLHPL